MIRGAAPAIGAEALLFSDLLQKGLFEVPWHQRRYDWEEEDVNALLLDVDEAVREKRRCYFVGAVIVVEIADRKWEINDGQQRMVTVSLICAALCRRFAEDIGDSQREGLALRLLFDLDRNQIAELENAEHYRPRIEASEDDNVRYKQMIRGNTIGANGKLTAAWRLIDEFLGTANEGHWWERYFDYLLEHLEVACLNVPRDIDPNAVFETINCRGKPLDDLDLIRNFIYSHFNAGDEVERRKTVHRSLERVRQVFPVTKTRNKAEEYARCRLQCRFGFLSKDHLYRDVRKMVREEIAAPKFANRSSDYVFDLATEIARETDVELFRRLTTPTASPEFLHEFEVRSRTAGSPRKLSVFLRELKEYSVTHTLVFALMAKYVDEPDGRRQRGVANLVSKNLGRLATVVLRTAFVSKFEPSRFERHFADFAKEISISKGVPDVEFAQFLRECDRAEQNVLDDEQFETLIASTHMRGSQKIKTLLLGVNRDGHPDADVLNDANCSVEHVLPKGEEHWSGWKGFASVDPGEWVHRLGNLTLMARTDNRPGGKFNGNFENKAGVFAESSVAVTRAIGGCESWSPEEIEMRQRKMAKQVVRVWSFV